MNRWIVFAMVAMMPKTASLPGVEDTGADAFVERFRKESSLMIWLGVAFGAVLFMLLPIATVGVPLPASLLSAEKLDAHAKKCASFPVYVLKQPLFLVKMVAGLCWAADPRVRAQFNLPAYDSDPGTWRTT